jgi:hypothetical protein
MHNSLEVMEIALRVLTAASYKHALDPSDLAKLEEYTGPKPEGMDVDEFACRAVQEALKRRANLRAKGRPDGAESARA